MSPKTTSNPPDKVKFEIPRKWIIPIVVLLLGGGGLAGDLGDVTDLLKQKNSPPDEAASPRKKHREDKRFVKINITLDEHTAQITELDHKTEDIQTVQHRDIARQEARLATEKIKNRERREREYDRIFARNLARLKKGKAPCADLRCAN
jgi:hypothetical protein